MNEVVDEPVATARHFGAYVVLFQASVGRELPSFILQSAVPSSLQGYLRLVILSRMLKTYQEHYDSAAHLSNVTISLGLS